MCYCPYFSHANGHGLLSLGSILGTILDHEEVRTSPCSSTLKLLTAGWFHAQEQDFKFASHSTVDMEARPS